MGGIFDDGRGKKEGNVSVGKGAILGAEEHFGNRGNAAPGLGIGSTYEKRRDTSDRIGNPCALRFLTKGVHDEIGIGIESRPHIGKRDRNMRRGYPTGRTDARHRMNGWNRTNDFLPNRIPRVPMGLDAKPRHNGVPNLGARCAQLLKRGHDARYRIPLIEPVRQLRMQLFQHRAIVNHRKSEPERMEQTDSQGNKP